MPTRSRQTWKLDAQGQYARQIGWKKNPQGKQVQHKFRLGADLIEARRREQRLRELWEVVEASSRNGKSLWDDLSLEIARQLAKGAIQVILAPHEGESDAAYAQRVQLAERRFPAIRFQMADIAKYATGSDRETYSLSDLLIWPVSPQEEYARSRSASGTPLGLLEDTQTHHRSNPPVPVSQTLHQAMRDYKAWIEQHYFHPDLDRISSTGQTKLKQIETLIERHEDVSLRSLGFETIEQMICYWRRRPNKKGTKSPVSRVSAENYIGELKRFFKWLHRSSHYAWRKPEDFAGIDTSVDTDSADTRRRLVQAAVFSLDELILLNQYATPLDRIFLLLGLNCGFGVAEIASLTIEEVCLFQAHSPRDQELLHFETTDGDSFIKRVRPKSGVYGEFLLFQQTVQGLQWAMKRRRKQSDFHPEAPLFLNGRGERFDKPTKSGNRNQQIPNQFTRLQQRIRSDKHDLNNLSFGKLRKTAADLIRRFSDFGPKMGAN